MPPILTRCLPLRGSSTRVFSLGCYPYTPLLKGSDFNQKDTPPRKDYVSAPKSSSKLLTSAFFTVVDFIEEKGIYLGNTPYQNTLSRCNGVFDHQNTTILSSKWNGKRPNPLILKGCHRAVTAETVR
jgi:hypothetical protein